MTEEDKKKLREAEETLIGLVSRMERNGNKEIIFNEKQDNKINIHMIKNIIRALYEIEKGEIR